MSDGFVMERLEQRACGGVIFTIVRELSFSAFVRPMMFCLPPPLKKRKGTKNSKSLEASQVAMVYDLTFIQIFSHDNKDKSSR